MIPALLLTLAANPVSVTIHVDGSGFLRFLRGDKRLYSSDATLVDRNGVLATADGSLLTPKINVPADCTELTVTLDGFVRATTPSGSREIGQLVLTMLPDSAKRSGLFSSNLQGRLSDPGDGLAGVIRMHREPRGSVLSLMVQGPVHSTGSPLDLAIEGRGFFQIVQSDGTYAYTRNGNFQLDSVGEIVTRDGLPLFPKIFFPAGATSIAIAADGTVTYVKAGGTSPIILGQVTTVCFANPDGLRRIGPDRFVRADAAGIPTTCAPGQCGAGSLLAGYLEDLNAGWVTEEVVPAPGGGTPR